jgi:hypothetical protein
MSVAKLLLSGLLVASGLILGTFTLHGYLDPQWLQRQMQAANPHDSGAKWVLSIEEQSPSEAEIAPEEGGPRHGPIKTALRPDAADAKAAAAKAKKLADKKLAEKKLAEKRRAEQKAKEQTASQWPWNWLSSLTAAKQ